MPTLTVYPSGYDQEHISIAAFASSYPATNAYNSADNTSVFAQININRGEYAESYIYFTFDLSALPVGARITSVSCDVRAYINQLDTNHLIDTAFMQMSSSQTLKGSPTNFTGTETKHTLDVGTWTAEELEHACLYIYVKRTNINTTTARPTRIFGATLTIDYTWNPLNDLITDRTQSDVDELVALLKKDSFTVDELTAYQNSKGAYNYTDLNRVESAVAYLAAALVQAPVDLRQYASDRNVAWDDYFDVSYDPDDYDDLTTKTDWANTDIPSASQMARYLSNVALIQAAFPNNIILPPSMNNLTFEGANNIERALIAAYESLTETIDTNEGYIRSAMEVSYSGEIYSGEGIA